jgi:putative SOS response-associated peptidase YedK
MCGLFTLRTRQTTIFNREMTLAETPRYKIYPGEPIFAIRLDAGTPELAEMKWGFRPSWAPAKRTCINIRSETAATSPMFKRAYKTARCLIPADGFYEPDRSVPGKAYAWFRRPEDRLFYFPGLWTRYESEPAFDNCGLLTTRPNRIVGAYHARMPVVLGRAAAEFWLESTAVDRLAALLEPAADDALAARPVTSALYRLRADDPGCLEPHR